MERSTARSWPTRSSATDVHEARTGLLCLEDTHNMCGGRVIAPETLRELAAPARARNLPVHMDGARIFNAAVALGIPVSALAAEVDSVMFCLSKGLSAPVGSMLAGSSEFISEARRMRKLLGGGMRQAGILAAAGIVALNEMVERLAEDHANARKLAEGLANIPGVAVDPSVVESNMVFFGAADGEQRTAGGLCGGGRLATLWQRRRAHPRSDTLWHHRRGHRHCPGHHESGRAGVDVSMAV